MNHFLSETARATHCVPRCKSLMRLKHLEMLELPLKRSSVLSTEGDGRQCGCQEAHLLMNHCKTESVGCIRLGDSVTEVSSNTSTHVSGVGIPPSTAVVWCSLGSHRLGMEG